MKTLVVFYSRTNTNKKVAEDLARKLNADLEEIKSIKTYRGIFGYLAAGREGLKKIPAKIEPSAKETAQYDLLVLGTPIWVGKIASPVRAYLEQQKDGIKKVAFFCVCGGSDTRPVFNEMAELCGRQPVATLALRTKEIKENDFEEKLNKFSAMLE